MTTVLEPEKSSSVPQGSNREGLIFEHSKRGRRGYRLPALDVPEAALPILRLASDLIRKLIAADRRQSHNLRVTALRSEVRALRRMIRARNRRESFENSDPERLRLPQAQDRTRAGLSAYAQRRPLRQRHGGRP